MIDCESEYRDVQLFLKTMLLRAANPFIQKAITVINLPLMFLLFILYTCQRPKSIP